MKTRALLAAVVLSLPTSAAAEVVWAGGFESGDLSEWDFLLNPTIDGTDYTTVVQDLVVDGQFAGRIELHDDARWGNGLRRVELQHRPDAGRTAEGAETFFAWSFYLPEELSADPSQQIGYWESRNSFRQMMSFTLRASNLSFVTRQPDNVVHWDGIGAATPGEWHRIAMRVLWSKDPAVGTVSVWFDGAEVVSDVSAKTLNDDNEHFVQVGLLRGDADFADVPVIYLDDAVEGDTLEDVRPDQRSSSMEPDPQDMGTVQPDGGGDSDMGPPLTDTGSSSTDSGSSVPAADTGAPATESDGSIGGDTEDTGCCTQVSAAKPGTSALLLVLGALFSRRRKRR